MLFKKNAVLGGIVVIFFTFLETVGGQDNEGSLISSKSNKEDKTAVIGTNITLHCGIEYTLQHDDILEWSKGNDDILVVKNTEIQQNADEKRFSLALSPGGSNTSLNISRVKDTDSGSYSCCIVNTERRCIRQNVVVENKSSIIAVSDGKNGTSNSQNGTDTEPKVFAAGAAAAAVALAAVLVGIGGYYLFKEYKKRFNKRTGQNSTGDETNIPLKTIP